MGIWGREGVQKLKVQEVDVGCKTAEWFTLEA